MTQSREFFITCAKGVEDLLLKECQLAGVNDAIQLVGGVSFRGELRHAYHLCLWSRVASRVLLKLSQSDVSDYDSLYAAVSAIDWSLHMTAINTLAIDCFSSHQQINNSHFATLKIKDAIVDQLRQSTGQRPDIEKHQPDIRINAYVNNTNKSISCQV